MRNLARLTNAANRIENGPNTIDRRRGPRCAEPGCIRSREHMPDGKLLAHCYKHMTEDESKRYKIDWNLKQ